MNNYITPLTEWPYKANALKKSKKSVIDWKKPKQEVKFLIESDQKIDNGEFSQILRNSNILDNTIISLPSASIILHHGAEYLSYFRTLLESFYHKYNLKRLEYPNIVPEEFLKGTKKLFGYQKNYFKTIANNSPDEVYGILLPTGESAIYTHWSKVVKFESDLPIEMYRNGTFFRPANRGKDSGQGLFSTPESSDVFEFHCAYKDSDSQQQGLAHYFKMLKAIADYLSLPVLWTTRPPWTNNFQVADRVIGGDCILPLWVTVQLSGLYDQGQKFSRQYEVKYKGKIDWEYTHQLTGYYSRRLLLASLLLGIKTDNTICANPNIAPYQLAVSLSGTPLNSQERKFINNLSTSYRVNLFTHKDLKLVLKNWKSYINAGIPLNILIHVDEKKEYKYKISLLRNDINSEATYYTNTLSNIPKTVKSALSEITYDYNKKMMEYFQSKIIRTKFEDLNKIIVSNKIAVIPLKAEKKALDELESGVMGEVLGFSTTNIVEKCVITNEDCNTVAFVARRN